MMVPFEEAPLEVPEEDEPAPVFDPPFNWLTAEEGPEAAN